MDRKSFLKKRKALEKELKYKERNQTVIITDQESKKPLFSFHHTKYGGSHCLTTCENIVQSSVAVTMVRLSQLTWAEIGLEPKDGLGYEKIHRHQFKVALHLPSTITPDVPILVFRHSSGGRIAGYKEENIYHILVIGQDLYDH